MLRGALRKCRSLLCCLARRFLWTRWHRGSLSVFGRCPRLLFGREVTVDETAPWLPFSIRALPREQQMFRPAEGVFIVTEAKAFSWRWDELPPPEKSYVANWASNIPARSRWATRQPCSQPKQQHCGFVLLNFAYAKSVQPTETETISTWFRGTNGREADTSIDNPGTPPFMHPLIADIPF